MVKAPAGATAEAAVEKESKLTFRKRKLNNW